MRYKFRGKRVDTGEWVVGGFHEHIKRQPCPVGDELCNDDVCSLIIQTGFADWNMPRPILAFEVIPESVGQFTGLLDKNGVEIYEGDVVSRHGGILHQGVYEYSDTIIIKTLEDIVLTSEFEVVYVFANIHDNPELMEVE